MAIRNLNSTLRTSLLNNDSFNYAHLVKFEKPTVEPLFKTEALLKRLQTILILLTELLILSGTTAVKMLQVLLTVAQKYNANKLQKIGSVTESTEAKAS